MTTTNLPFEHPISDLAEDPIGLGLKRLYDAVLEEAVPNDFMDFLSQIDANADVKADNIAPKAKGVLGDKSSGPGL